MVKRTTVVLTRSEMLLPCDIKGTFHANLGLVEHVGQRSMEDGLTVCRTLIDPEGEEVPVVVANFFLRLKKVRQRTVVGLWQEFDQEPQSCVCRRSLMKPQEELADYLRDLFARTSQCWTEPQVEQLRELLVKHAGVFSTGDLDVGCTDLVEY